MTTCPEQRPPLSFPFLGHRLSFLVGGGVGHADAKHQGVRRLLPERHQCAIRCDMRQVGQSHLLSEKAEGSAFCSGPSRNLEPRPRRRSLASAQQPEASSEGAQEQQRILLKEALAAELHLSSRRCPSCAGPCEEAFMTKTKRLVAALLLDPLPKFPCPFNIWPSDQAVVGILGSGPFRGHSFDFSAPSHPAANESLAALIIVPCHIHGCYIHMARVRFASSSMPMMYLATEHSFYLAMLRNSFRLQQNKLFCARSAALSKKP